MGIIHLFNLKYYFIVDIVFPAISSFHIIFFLSDLAQNVENNEPHFPVLVRCQCKKCPHCYLRAVSSLKTKTNVALARCEKMKNMSFLVCIIF